MAKDYESITRRELALIDRISEKAIFWGLVSTAAMSIVGMLTGVVAFA